MPSPIAHAVTGYALARLIPFNQKRKDWNKQEFFQLSYSIFIAIAPDLDFIPQILTGVRYHHGLSHSLTFTFGFSITVWVIAHFLAKPISKRLFLLTLMGYGSHLLLDFFTDGGSGIQLLWPFTEEYMRSSVAIFPSTHHSKPLLDPGHVIFVVFELSYALILLGSVWFLTYNRGRGELSTDQKMQPKKT